MTQPKLMNTFDPAENIPGWGGSQRGERGDSDGDRRTQSALATVIDSERWLHPGMQRKLGLVRIWVGKSGGQRPHRRDAPIGRRIAGQREGSLGV